MGQPIHESVIAKSSATITPAIERFIQRTPFAALATYDADGHCDVSPRGDPPGFIQVINSHTLVLPERPGNKRMDSLINIIERPQLALLCVIPGVLDTVRINGRGVVNTDPELRAGCAIDGKVPELTIVITVEEAFGHCSKAMRRSRLWQEDYRAPAGVPTLREMMLDHLAADAQSEAMLDAGIRNDVETRMY